MKSKLTFDDIIEYEKVTSIFPNKIFNFYIKWKYKRYIKARYEFIKSNLL